MRGCVVIAQPYALVIDGLYQTPSGCLGRLTGYTGDGKRVALRTEHGVAWYATSACTFVRDPHDQEDHRALSPSLERVITLMGHLESWARSPMRTPNEVRDLAARLAALRETTCP